MTDTTIAPNSVAFLATTTKAPVTSVFDSLTPAGCLETELFAIHSGHKQGSVKTALRLLVTNGFVAKRNNQSGKKGRPAVRYFRTSDAPALPEPKPAKVESVSTPESTETQPEPIAVLAEITG